MAKAAKNTEKNAMHYPEHEATYELFIWLSKWGIAFCCFLMVAMAVGFEMGGGFIGGTIIFIISMIASKFFIKK
ncbi:MAG: aa3-type cytochrome c oxidase subunit IV [Nitratireductor sp.]